MIENYIFIDSIFPWFYPTFVFLLGACIGSFLNVCIYRIPKGESILWPPSHSSTGRRLSWWENIPIIAWIYLRGRDRITKEPYSIRYPTVELLTAVLFLICWFKSPPLVAIVGMLFIAILIVSTFIDIDHMIIPDTFSIGGMLLGLFLSFWIPQLHLASDQMNYLSNGFVSGIHSLISALVGAGLVFWIGELGEVVFRKPAMGLGDVKLVGCIGAFCGWQGAVFSLFGGAVIGCLLLLPWMIFQYSSNKKSSSSKTKNNNEVTESDISFGLEIPFGPMLALGALVYLLAADQWVDSYFEFVKQMIFS